MLCDTDEMIMGTGQDERPDIRDTSSKVLLVSDTHHRRRSMHENSTCCPSIKREPKPFDTEPTSDGHFESIQDAQPKNDANHELQRSNGTKV